MLDFDLADIYQTETKRLNQQVKRNIERFPEDFMFQLSKAEWDLMRSQIVTASDENKESEQHTRFVRRNITALPFAFTEHGVTMLAGVLRSNRAIKMSIAVTRAFIALTQFAIHYKNIAHQITEIRSRLGNHDEQLHLIYDSIESLLDQKVEQKSWEDRQRIGFLNEKPRQS